MKHTKSYEVLEILSECEILFLCGKGKKLNRYYEVKVYFINSF